MRLVRIRSAGWSWLFFAMACSAQPTDPASPAGPGPGPTAAASANPRRVPCSVDADCRYDAAGDRCAVDPSLGATPPIVDQGVQCFCAGAWCQGLAVAPAPCDGDDACAIRDQPRPHPVSRRSLGAAGRALPSKLPCSAGVALSVKCERTNICTLHRTPCEAGPR